MTGNSVCLQRLTGMRLRTYVHELHGLGKSLESYIDIYLFIYVVSLHPCERREKRRRKKKQWRSTVFFVSLDEETKDKMQFPNILKSKPQSHIINTHFSHSIGFVSDWYLLLEINPRHITSKHLNISYHKNQKITSNMSVNLNN